MMVNEELSDQVVIEYVLCVYIVWKQNIRLLLGSRK